MIQNYDSSRIYEIYEIQQTGKKYKIGEIENHVFYDINKRGKRLEHKYHFNNNPEFWNQFKNISVKKISRPLGGFEPVVWGSYWTLSVLVTIFFVLMRSPFLMPCPELPYLVASSILLTSSSNSLRSNEISVFFEKIEAVVICLPMQSCSAASLIKAALSLINISNCFFK